MTRPTESGLTLVELLITLTIMGIIAVAAMPLLSTSLEANRQGTARSQLYQEGLLAMERMTSGVRRCTFLLIPNAHKTTRDILAFSGFVNEDGDYYFGDSLFPRIDEDPYNDSNNDGQSGIAGIDDNGDGFIDDWVFWWDDDDEDKSYSEDWLDGKDNDSDGNIDEDWWRDNNKDGFSGIVGIDDDGDGLVDEEGDQDDDEDGSVSEDNLNETIYVFDSGTHTLIESVPFTSESVILSTHVTLFQAIYEPPDAAHGPRVQVALTLTGDEGESVQFVEYAYPRNTLQRTGKRVR